MNKNLLAV